MDNSSIFTSGNPSPVDWIHPSDEDIAWLEEVFSQFPKGQLEYDGKKMETGAWRIRLYLTGSPEAFDLSGALCMLLGLPGQLLPLDSVEELERFLMACGNDDLAMMAHCLMIKDAKMRSLRAGGHCTMTVTDFLAMFSAQ